MNKMEQSHPKRLLVMAGGTGGHVFPGIAVAKKLQQEGWQIRWLGTADRMEADLVPKHGFEIDFIQVSGLRGASWQRKCLAPLMVFKAMRQALSYIKQFKPDAVLGMGGYVCGPGGLAAYLKNVPLIIHEQNAVAGLTNRWLSRIATKVLQAFPGAFSTAEVVGNPVRDDLAQVTQKQEICSSKPLNLLVMGGSQGAMILNQEVPKALALVSTPIHVRHQAGKGHLNNTREFYQAENIGQFEVVEFIDDVKEAYQWADLVICRSGALTVSELAAVGLPAIFVPFQHQDRQQALNAEFLVKAEAALMIEQNQLNAASLAQLLMDLEPKQLHKMAQAAKACARHDAAKRVADVIQSVVDARETK